MTLSSAKTGPPVVNARETPATCWKLVARAAVFVLHRQGHAPTRISSAKIGLPVDTVRATPATCWKPVVRAAASALQRQDHSRPQVPRVVAADSEQTVRTV